MAILSGRCVLSGLNQGKDLQYSRACPTLDFLTRHPNPSSFATRAEAFAKQT
jgi:hypothetical protein